MENENKRRSGSYEPNKGTQGSSDEATKKLSLSEGSIVDKDSTSETGTLKKPRKFKPKKFIAKRLNLKKKDKDNEESDVKTPESAQSEQDLSSSSKKSSLTSKLSPKLQRFNFVKRFSGKKTYKVSPSADDGVDETESNLKQYKSLSMSDSSTLEDVKKLEINDDDSNSEPSTEIIDFEGPEKESGQFISEIDIPIGRSASSLTKEAVTLESKKVELKITISGKKVERRASPQSNASDEAFNKASQQTQITSEPLQKQADIKLPVTTSDQARTTLSRELFFNSFQPSSNTGHVEQNNKPIKNDPTFALVVKEGLSSVKSTPAENSNEVEKYQLITSSLNTIISEAKKLEDLSVDQSYDKSGLKFPPNFPQLKIQENNSKVETVNDKTENKNLSDEEVDENMKKQGQKTKIPIDIRRLSGSLTEVNGSHNGLTATVHTQEAHQPYHLHLSSSSVEESNKQTPLNADEIRFEVGTSVRPLRTSPASSSVVSGPSALSDNPICEINSPDSSLEVFHSPKSEKISEPLRRRIAYVPQLSTYTPEEQELLKSNLKVNASDSIDLNSFQQDSSMFPVFDDSVESTMTSSPEKREHLYKILVIGELGTGKTSFIKRYVHRFFSQNYRATIGVDFALKVLNWDQSTIIRLQLWDIAGQERFGNMTRVYYKEAVGAFIVFDVTRSATFDAVIKWKQDLDSKVQLPDGSPIPCILLANKCDQEKQGLVTMPAKMDDYCKQNGFAGWFETSAKDNVNIEESTKALVSKILVNDKLIHNDILDADRININAEDENLEKKKFCSC
ncbi:CLUMA_CG021414, isoform A [Clunio marinus]|uniref:CLUMA_CG021414, isoform A n=1 Tax=Clunio marinus TaxID=568069 RepID=A0A1J1J980_9DIPT|nr:CLUMA_CG021414, isoform A [Clunio marinus]